MGVDDHHSPEGAAMTRAPQLFAVSVLLFVGVFSAAVAGECVSG